MPELERCPHFLDLDVTDEKGEKMDGSWGITRCVFPANHQGACQSAWEMSDYKLRCSRCDMTGGWNNPVKWHEVSGIVICGNCRDIMGREARGLQPRSREQANHDWSIKLQDATMVKVASSMYDDLMKGVKRLKLLDTAFDLAYSRHSETKCKEALFVKQPGEGENYDFHCTSGEHRFTIDRKEVERKLGEKDGHQE